MKTFKICVFLLSILLIFSSCGDRENASEDLTNNSLAECRVDSTKYIYFDSIDEFYSKIESSDFTDEELEMINYNVSLYKDYKGEYVCSTDDIYKLILPLNVEFGEVAWYGRGYLMGWEDPENAIGIMHLVDEDEYYEWMNRRYYNDLLFAGNDLSGLEDYEILNFTEAEYDGYSLKTVEFIKDSSKSRIEKYEAVRDDTEYIVFLEYFLDYTGEFESLENRVSETVPYSVNIYGKTGDQYWFNDLGNIREDAEIDIEWLLSFDIEKYKK